MAERLSKLEFEDESLVALTPIVANSVSNINNVEEESGLSRADIVQGSLLRIILTYMISNHYEEASRAIEDHVDSRRDYPGFRDRTERFREHANQVIIAIQQQRELLKASNLSNSKQHDLRGRIQYQFKELRKSLVSI